MNKPGDPRKRNEPLALALPLALVMGGAVVLGAAAAWGRPGLASALIGVALSLANLWALRRLSRRAVRLALSDGAGTALPGLLSGLSFKTAALLMLVWMLAAEGAIQTMPLALGLLVGVLGLLASGLAEASLDAREAR